jgi:uncharacterized membrane-anchored protein
MRAIFNKLFAKPLAKFFAKSLVLKYAAIAILPLGALLWQPAVNFAALEWGERVLLRTRPLDPRDFLRGDYVVLDYDISDIPEKFLPKDGVLPSDKKGDEGGNEDDDDALFRSGWKRQAIGGGLYRDVYVALDLDEDGIGSMSGASFARPSAGLYLKGTIFWRWGSYTVDYGLGVYYVPEGTGRAIEDMVRQGDVLADVRVFRGRAMLKSLRPPGPPGPPGP